jgi:hypothetical protein
MCDVALQMEHVYKKFRKGEVYNSLRDLLPALTGRMFRQQELSDINARRSMSFSDLDILLLVLPSNVRGNVPISRFRRRRR